MSELSLLASVLAFRRRANNAALESLPALSSTVSLTHLCLASHKRDTDKQCWPRSDYYMGWGRGRGLNQFYAHKTLTLKRRFEQLGPDLLKVTTQTHKRNLRSTENASRTLPKVKTGLYYGSFSC